jgi:sulfur-oxidizing protein SoxY
MNTVKRRRSMLAAALALPTWPVLAQLKSATDPKEQERWERVRSTLFAGRTIDDDGDAVAKIDVPARAIDAALMPLAIRVPFAQTPERHVQTLWLVIDNNPSPLSSVFTFGPASGRAEIATRVRVDEYSHVRVISQTNDGKLHASTRFVKASGGCSAPPGKDAAAAAATLGQVHLSLIEPASTPARANQIVQAQLAVSHPNDSGFVMDQLSRQQVPPHFVRRVEVNYGNELVFAADVDFSISENPNFRFFFRPRQDGELVARITDSKERRFEGRLAVRLVN